MIPRLVKSKSEGNECVRNNPFSLGSTSPLGLSVNISTSGLSASSNADNCPKVGVFG